MVSPSLPVLKVTFSTSPYSAGRPFVGWLPRLTTVLTAAIVTKVGTTSSPSIWGSASSTWWLRSAQSLTVSWRAVRYSGATGAPFGAFVVKAIRIRPGSAPISERNGRAGDGAAYGSPGPAPEVASSRAAVSRTVRVTACSVEQPPSPSPEYGAWELRPLVG